MRWGPYGAGSVRAALALQTAPFHAPPTHTLSHVSVVQAPADARRRIHPPHSIITEVWLPSPPDLLTLNQAEMEWADNWAVAAAIKEPLLLSVQIIRSAAALLLRFSALRRKKSLQGHFLLLVLRCVGKQTTSIWI